MMQGPVAKPPGRPFLVRLLGYFGLSPYAGLRAEKFFFALVDNCPAGLQWRVPQIDNIHKCQRRQSSVFPRLNLYHD